MKHLSRVALVLPLLVPAAVFAQTVPKKISTINDLTAKAVGIGNVLVYLLVGFAVLYIVYETVRYFILADSEEARKEAGSSIFYGLVGLFVIVSIWGLVNILIKTFPTGDNTAPDRLPSTDFTNGGINNLTPAGGSNSFYDTPTNPTPDLYSS